MEEEKPGTAPAKEQNLEDVFQGLFQHSESNDEGLLRIESTFSRFYWVKVIKQVRTSSTTRSSLCPRFFSGF